MKEVLKIVPPPSIPMAVARALVKAFFSTATGALTLRVHKGHFYKWSGQHWSAMDTDDVRGEVYRQLEHAQYEHLQKGTQPFAPSKGKIDNVLDALRAIVELDANAEAPCWTDAASLVRLPANEIVSMANGLLHIPTRTPQPHTPLFFCHHSVGFAYAPDADPPKRWLRFLDELWGRDESSINALQEVMGYLLGGGTRLQKIFLFVGPKRAGKGTIGRVLTGLLGAHSVAGPTLASLSTHFGLSALIGKPLGLISDVRLSKRSDSNVVVERLLSVSGEDGLTIDRKYRKPWTGRLPTRFVVMTNESSRRGRFDRHQPVASPRAGDRRRCRRFEFPVRAGKTPSGNGMPRSRAETWVQARAAPGPERAGPLRHCSPGLDSRSSRDESAKQTTKSCRHGAGMVPADRRLIKFSARG